MCVTLVMSCLPIVWPAMVSDYTLITCNISTSWLCSNWLDIDECSLGITSCSHLCVNTIGSFFCECYTGYYLSTDGSCIGLWFYYSNNKSSNEICLSFRHWWVPNRKWWMFASVYQWNWQLCMYMYQWLWIVWRWQDLQWLVSTWTFNTFI